MTEISASAATLAVFVVIAITWVCVLRDTCQHKWDQVGIWSDKAYRAHPLLICGRCNKTEYARKVT